MLQGVSFSEIFGFQIEWPFREFVQICCLVNVVLQNLALPMDWTSGLKGLVVHSAHRWPGVGLVLGCLHSAPIPRQDTQGMALTLGANASWFWDVWQRDDALKCSLGVPSGNWLACWRGGLSLLETAHVWICLNRSYELLHWIRIWCCRGCPFLRSLVFRSDELSVSLCRFVVW